MTTLFTLRESRASPSSGEVCLEVCLDASCGPSLCLHLFFNTMNETESRVMSLELPFKARNIAAEL